MHRFLAPLVAIAMLASSLTVPATAVAASGPVAHWDFDETSGSVLLDQSGGGRDGSFAGQVTRIDDGIDDRALRLHSVATNVGADGAGLSSEHLTVSIWVRSASTPATGTALLEKGARDCDGASYGLYVDDGGLEVRLMNRAGAIADYPLTSAPELWDGEWHHVSFTHSWFTSQLRMYIDGRSWGWSTFSLVINEVDLTSMDFAFGGSAAGSGCGVPAYVGDLDDIRIWDRVLDRQELGALEPAIETTTALSAKDGVVADVIACLTATVSPTPQHGTVNLYEVGPGGNELLIGIPANSFCSTPGPEPPQGTFMVPVRFYTKGVHRVVARFIPGNPWLPSASAIVDQFVAGTPTTTYIDHAATPAGQPIDLTVSVTAGGPSVNGLVSLYETSGGDPELIATQSLGQAAGSSVRQTTFTIQGRTAGTYEFLARYAGTTELFEPSERTASIVVEPVTTPVDTVAPIVTAPRPSLASGTAITSGRVLVRVPWTGSDAASGIDRYELEQQTDGGTWTSVSASLTNTSIDRPLVTQHSYAFRVRAVDNAGNVSAWATGSSFRLNRYIETSAAVRYTGAWTTTKSSAYWGGIAKRSASSGATASLTTTSNSVAWVTRKGPDRGKATVYVNGVKVSTIDLYASTFQNQRVAWVGNWTSTASRKVTIRVAATPGRPRVDIDGFVDIR